MAGSQLSLDTISSNEFGPLKKDLLPISDNSTRWNSAYLSIERALRLQEPLTLYLTCLTDLANEDKLIPEDWEQLKAIHSGLKPFWEVTLRLQGHASNGSHGVIWEALPCLDWLCSHIEDKMNELRQTEGPRRRGNNASGIPHNPLAICYQNAWEKLTDYNEKTDKSYGIYAAGALLNPCLRKRYFTWSWTGTAALQVEPMIQTNRDIWETSYRQPLPTPATQRPRSGLDIFLGGMAEGPVDSEEDDFSRYINGSITSATNWKSKNLFAWWDQGHYPELQQWAFDVLSIPATSTELERVFSQSKRTLTDDRNRMAAARFEATQCLKHWLDQGLWPVAPSDI